MTLLCNHYKRKVIFCVLILALFAFSISSATTEAPTKFKNPAPTTYRTKIPTPKLKLKVTAARTAFPTTPTIHPTRNPSRKPIATTKPTRRPSQAPSLKPTIRPTRVPSQAPSKKPSKWQTASPSSSLRPSYKSSINPQQVTSKPSAKRTQISTHKPSYRPTMRPSKHPSSKPSFPTISQKPSSKGTRNLTRKPTRQPSPATSKPSRKSSSKPTTKSTRSPTTPAVPSKKKTSSPTNRPLTPDTCEPIYPGCTCHTKKLSCQNITNMYNHIAEYINSFRNWSMGVVQQYPNPTSYPAGKVIGGIIRLAFHDAVEYDQKSNGADGMRSDGCIDFSNTLNAGLELSIRRFDPIWKQYCSIISRADFWVLAAKTAVEESVPYVVGSRGPTDITQGGVNRRRRKLLQGVSLHNYYWIPFNYGRIDRKNCSNRGGSALNDPTRRIPHPEGDVMEIKNFVQDKFGLDSLHTVALIGVHCIGHANMSTSGYNSSWQDRADLFVITYFKLLAALTWKRTAMTDPFTGAQISQWNIVKVPQGKNNNALMLTASDISMLFNVSKIPMNQTCGPYSDLTFVPLPPPPAVITKKKYVGNTCPYTEITHPGLNYSQHILYFAQGNTNSEDEPGASRFMVHWATAFTKMVSVGYAPRDLTCAMCIPTACRSPSCSYQEMCVTGALDAVDEPWVPLPQISTNPAKPGTSTLALVVKTLAGASKGFSIGASGTAITSPTGQAFVAQCNAAVQAAFAKAMGVPISSVNVTTLPFAHRARRLEDNPSSGNDTGIPLSFLCSISGIQSDQDTNLLHTQMNLLSTNPTFMNSLSDAGLGEILTVDPPMVVVSPTPEPTRNPTRMPSSAQIRVISKSNQLISGGLSLQFTSCQVFPTLALLLILWIS